MFMSLQACRAAAAALVVLFHLGGTFAQDRYFGFKALDGPFAWGDSGVDFFFVLSGFLITALHRQDFDRPSALGAYLGKRLTRIYPTYWVVCAAVCIAALAAPALRQALPSDFATFAEALALLPQDPALVGGTGSPILFVAWSLQYELLFYGLVALAIVSRRVALLAMAALLAVQLGCQVGSSCSFPLGFLANPLVLLFGMGAAAALLMQSRLPVPAPRALAAACGLAFVGYGLLETHYGRAALPWGRPWVYGLLACGVVVGLSRAEARGELIVRQRWLQLLGDSSYALYLMHIPIISLLVKVVQWAGITRHALLVPAFAGIFAACVGASLLFHLKLEKPMLAWLRGAVLRWTRRLHRAAAPQRRHTVLPPPPQAGP